MQTPALLKPHPSRSAPKCVDCAHSATYHPGSGRIFCNHSSTPIDAATGLPVVLAEDMRSGYYLKERFGLQPCGDDGSLFAARAMHESGASSQALQPEQLHQGGADPIRPAEEDDDRSFSCSVEDFQRLGASGTHGINVDKVDGQPLGRLVVLGVVVRQGEVASLLTDFAQLLAAVGRLHDGRNEGLARGEGVEDQKVLAAPCTGDRADYAQDGLPIVVFSEASEPGTGARGETACLPFNRVSARDWSPWLGHGALITLPDHRPA